MVIVFDINRPCGFLLRAWTKVSVLEEHIRFHAAVRVLAKDWFECLRLVYHFLIVKEGPEKEPEQENFPETEVAVTHMK